MNYLLSALLKFLFLLFVFKVLHGLGWGGVMHTHSAHTQPLSSLFYRFFSVTEWLIALWASLSLASASNSYILSCALRAEAALQYAKKNDQDRHTRGPRAPRIFFLINHCISWSILWRFNNLNDIKINCHKIVWNLCVSFVARANQENIYSLWSTIPGLLPARSSLSSALLSSYFLFSQWVLTLSSAAVLHVMCVYAKKRNASESG